VLCVATLEFKLVSFDLTPSRAGDGVLVRPGLVQCARHRAEAFVELRVERWSAARTELRLDVVARRRRDAHVLDVANDTLDALRDLVRPRTPTELRARFATR
jgi:hypothetical protein